MPQLFWQTLRIYPSFGLQAERNRLVQTFFVYFAGRIVYFVEGFDNFRARGVRE